MAKKATKKVAVTRVVCLTEILVKGNEGEDGAGAHAIVTLSSLEGTEEQSSADAQAVYTFLRSKLPDATWGKLFDLMGIEAARTKDIMERVKVIMRADQITQGDRFALADVFDRMAESGK